MITSVHKTWELFRILSPAEAAWVRQIGARLVTNNVYSDTISDNTILVFVNKIYTESENVELMLKLKFGNDLLLISHEYGYDDEQNRLY